MELKITQFCNVMWLRVRSTMGGWRDGSLGKSTFVLPVERYLASRTLIVLAHRPL